MLVTISHLIVVLVFFKNGAVCNQQHLICKSVEDVFDENRPTANAGAAGASQIDSTYSEGTRGKAGPVGPPGIRGLPGPPGLSPAIDYDKLNKTVEEKISRALEQLQKRIAVLEGNVPAPTLVPEETKVPTKKPAAFKCSKENLIYNDTCYSTPYISKSRDLGHSAAVEACREIGFKLAEIHDKTQQEELEKFIRSKIASLSLIYLWLGMTFNPKTKSLKYEAGNYIDADQLTWFPRYPSSASFHIHTLIGVRKSGTDGIWNYFGTKAHGVICEKKM